MYIKQLTKDEKEALESRRAKIKTYQENEICFSCTFNYFHG